jgi:hypothetical protein
MHPDSWNENQTESVSGAQAVEAPPLRHRAAKLANLAWPWLLFTALLAWGWRTTDLFHAIPSYGDVLEGLWALIWYDDALRLGASPALYPLAFHPIGFYVQTYAWGVTNFLLLIPLYRVAGAAFAYNVAVLITFLVAFAGTYLLAQRFMPRLGAAIAACLYTFWGFRWYGVIGQLNVNLGSALLPWIILSLDRGLASQRRSWAWFILAGVFWALSVNSSMYYVWIGGFAVLAWLFGWALSRRAGWREILRSGTVVLLTSVVLSLPGILAFWRASAAAGAPPFTIYDLNVLGASVNSLPIPSLSHPFLRTLARSIYHGSTGSEAAMANLGLLASLSALVGLMAVRRSRAWRPVLVLGCVGLILALGLTLRWNDQMIQVSPLDPLNRIIWQVGHFIKPGFFFVGPEPPGDFKAAIPLPGLFMATVVPYFAEARVLARYTLLAGLAIFLLGGLGVTRIRLRWLQLALAALLVFEVLPPPTRSFAFPPLSHPVFDWLREQNLGGEGIMELSPDTEARLSMPGGGASLWATLYHQQATTSGPGGIWPAHISYLVKWLAEHPHPFQDSDFISLVRAYRIRYVALHMSDPSADDVLQEAQRNEELQFIDCFPPASGAQPYDHPICILDVLPSRNPNFNVLFREGWSGPEDWGRWIDGTEARALWVATARTAQRLTLEVFPHCVPGREQQIYLEMNGVSLAAHQWTGCDTWSGEIPIPPDLVRVGSNELKIQTAYGVSPSELSDGADPDPRALSVGFTRLQMMGANE